MRGLAALITISSALAFAPNTVSRIKTRSSFLPATYELAPEPDGGNVLENGLDGSKMKELSVGEYWVQYKADSEAVSKLRTQILKDASKKAQFPGFRKGQIPPYAMPQMTTFALQEAITNSLEEVISSYGVRTLSGSEGNIDVKEKVEDIARSWKSGDVDYTATFKGEPVPVEASDSGDDAGKE